ncbi:MAG: RidA family protein [Gemmatimonadetes bacterium]|nr:RidA family protein [Gemmatimonadota bacterium]
MTRVYSMVMAALLVLPVAASAQRGGGGMGGMGGSGFGEARFPVPGLPGTEMDGPPDAAKATTLLSLTAEQAVKYTESYNAFITANKPAKDSIEAQLATMRQKLEAGDRAAATFYAEKAVRISKPMRERQDKWEDGLSKVLSGEQVKTFKKWRKDTEQAFEDKRRERALEWQPGGGYAFDRPGRPIGDVDTRTSINPGSAVGGMDGVSQAVRVGRTVYVSGQVALDSAGHVVGEGDLKAQATKAFANLAAVLRAGKAEPTDVVRMTVYVVNFKPDDMVAIRAAAADFFPGRTAPAMTVVGVQALFREGLLVAVDAIAQATNPQGPAAPPASKGRIPGQ